MLYVPGAPMTTYASELRMPVPVLDVFINVNELLALVVHAKSVGTPALPKFSSAVEKTISFGTVVFTVINCGLPGEIGGLNTA